MNTIRYDIVKTVPVESVVRLYSEAGWWHESDRAREIVPAMVAGSFCFITASTEAGEVVGMGRAISDGVSDAYLQDITVLQSYRGQGIGKEIVSRLTLHCRNRGLEWISLVAEPGTTEFYSRSGYKEMKNYVAMRYL